MAGKSKAAKLHRFGSAEQMEAAVELYFEECDQAKKPYTIEGLAVALDMDRAVLINFERSESGQKYMDVIGRAKARVLANLVERGLSGNGNTTVTIFNLKNNYGYKDKFEPVVDVVSNVIEVKFGE